MIEWPVPWFPVLLIAALIGIAIVAIIADNHRKKAKKVEVFWEEVEEEPKKPNKEIKLCFQNFLI